MLYTIRSKVKISHVVPVTKQFFYGQHKVRRDISMIPANVWDEEFCYNN